MFCLDSNINSYDHDCTSVSLLPHLLWIHLASFYSEVKVNSVQFMLTYCCTSIHILFLTAMDRIRRDAQGKGDSVLASSSLALSPSQCFFLSFSVFPCLICARPDISASLSPALLLFCVRQKLRAAIRLISDTGTGLLPLPSSSLFFFHTFSLSSPLFPNFSIYLFVCVRVCGFISDALALISRRSWRRTKANLGIAPLLFF